MKNIKEQKPLTLDQLADYANKVLLPAIDFRMDKKIENLKNELDSNMDQKMENLKNELDSNMDQKIEILKNDLLTKDDEIITKLDKIDTENTIRNAHEDREKNFHKIVVRHLETGSTSSEELSEIKELNVF
jgi:hypothetical protein